MSNKYNILTTKGITSRVNENENIGMFDFDDGISKSNLLNACMDIDGINALFLSSPGSYHLYNLSIRSRDEIALMGLQMGSDCKHIASGYKKNKWVLRITAKWKDGEIYKPAPTLLHTWLNPSTKPQSLPHMATIEALTGKIFPRKSAYTFTGDTINTEEYRTFTDEIKERLERQERTNMNRSTMPQ